MIKNNKGITLVSLVVTIIVLLILASVGTTSGISAYKYIKFNNAKAQFQTMQSHVNAWYEQSKTNSVAYGENISEKADETKLNKMKSDLPDIDFTGYKYFSNDYIKNTLDIEGITNDFLINIPNRTVLLFGGMEYREKTYYSVDDFGINNVEYEELSGTIEFSTTVNNNTIIIYNIKFPNNMKISKYNIQYQKPGEINYTTLTSDKKSNYTDDNGIVYNDAWNIDDTTLGTYKIKITTANENIKSAEKIVEK